MSFIKSSTGLCRKRIFGSSWPTRRTPSHQIRAPTQTPSKTRGVGAILSWKQGFTDPRNPPRHAAWTRLRIRIRTGSTLLSLQNVRESGGELCRPRRSFMADFSAARSEIFLHSSVHPSISSEVCSCSWLRILCSSGLTFVQPQTQRVSNMRVIGSGDFSENIPSAGWKATKLSSGKERLLNVQKNEGIEDQRRGGKLRLVNETLI